MSPPPGCHWLTRAVSCGWWPLRTGSTGERTEADQEKRWGHLPGCPAAPCSPGAGDHRPDRRFPGVSERGQGHKAREDSAASVGRGIVEAHPLRSPGFLRGWASLSQVLAGRRAVCPRHPHRYHVSQVDDHAILVCLAVIPGMVQNQAAPLVQRTGDRLKCLVVAGEILRYHGDVFTAYRVKSHDQHDVVRHGRSLPSREKSRILLRRRMLCLATSARPAGVAVDRSLSIVLRLQAADWMSGGAGLTLASPRWHRLAGCLPWPPHPHGNQGNSVTRASARTPGP